MSQKPITYDASTIQVLEGWEAVRKRPGMYIGSTGERGLHQVVFEVVGSAVNETLAGRARSIDVTVTLMADGGVRVADDRAGVSFEDGLEVHLTRLDTRAGLGAGRYPMLGFGVMGPFIANALSSRLIAEAQSEGVRRVQEYARGIAVTPPTAAAQTVGSGTVVTFWPDADIFGTTVCSFDGLAGHFREMAFLNRGLDISLTDQRRGSESQSVRFRSLGGVQGMVAFLDERAAAFVHPDIIGFELEDPQMAGTMEVAFRWRASGQESVRSFANCRSTPNGGTHVLGFHRGVAAAINAHARQRQLLAATEPDFGIDQISEGLTAVVSVKLEHPEFEGATRSVLGNKAAHACVREAVLEHLGRWLEDHPQPAADIIDLIRHRARPS